MSSTPAFSADQLLQHSGWARSLARQLVADAATADDVVQETWIAALREQPSTDRPLRPWLERVLRNFATNSRRNRKTRARHERAAGAGDSMATSVAEVVQKAEGQQRVVAAVLALSEPYRSVVLLRYYEGLSAAEIARRSDTPAGTVRWQVSQGLQLLREKLDAEESGDRRAWCAALLPLAGFQSVSEVAAAASVPALAADRARSSFLSILKGAVVMKSAWMVGVAAVSAVVLFWMWEDIGASPTINPVVQQAPVVAAVAETPDPAIVRSEAPVVADNQGDAVAGKQPWQASVKVRFVDRDGIGVAGVRVTLVEGYAPETTDHEEYLSDDEGRLEVPVLQPDGNRKKFGAPLSLTARHEVFANVQRAVPAAMLDGDGDAIELGTIELEAGGSITGQVVDVDGAPVVGARVSVSGRNEGKARTSNVLMVTMGSQDPVGRASAKTDASGNFRLDGVLPGSNEVRGTYLVGSTFVDELAGKQRVEVVAGSATPVALTLRASFEAKDIVTVIVEDPDGKPVPFAYVNMQSSRGNSSDYTDNDGRARCGFHNAGREVDVTVSVPDSRYAPVVHESAFLGQSVTIRFAKPVALPLTVASSAARTIATAKVRLHTVASNGFLGIGRKRAVDLISGDYEVAADGSVAGVILPIQRFMLEVQTRGHEVQSFGPYEPAQAKNGVKVTLTASPMVMGHVFDADGKPVVGAVVAIHRRPARKMTVDGFPVWLDPAVVDRIETDADGAFQLTVRGKESFFVRAHREGFAATMTDELTVADVTEAPDSLRLQLNQGGSINGYVLRGDGRSAAGSLVAVTRGDGFARTTLVDADGSYRFARLTAGKYHVQLTGEDLSSGGSSWQTSFGRPIQELPDPNCTVAVGKVTQCELGSRYVHDAKLHGRLRVPGWSLAGRRVVLEFADVKEGQLSPERWHATVDKQGRFQIPVLPSGVLLLRLADGTRLIEATLNVLPGENLFELEVETKLVTLRDLPTATQGGEPDFVIAHWVKDNATIQLPIDVAANGTAKVSLPKGKVSLQRMPTAADLGALMQHGGFTLIPFRELTIE